MRTLKSVTPTPEQIGILSRAQPGIELIRGAAGSGKTTTALLRLKSLIGFFSSKKRRTNDSSPIRVLVLTYNRTLRGYIDALTQEQAKSFQGVDLEVETFDRWALTSLGRPAILDNQVRLAKVRSLASNIPLSDSFISDEVEYAIGRFLPQDLGDYVTSRRHGRGASPRMERALRVRLLNEVILPYESWKDSRSECDWNDLAVRLAAAPVSDPYDIVIADEAQDFSANQVRAILKHLAPVHSLTFVLDSAQRIYARGFTWQEVGISIRPERIRKLSQNYRNTIEIARLAASLVKDVPIDDDGTIPDFNACTRSGRRPIVLRGRYSQQMEYAVAYIMSSVDLANESVAFLHTQGGRWFDEARRQLRLARLAFVEIARKADWPQGTENIALSTLHSAKGLEFDHVILLGLSAEITEHGQDEDDDKLMTLRRLLAMAVGRARDSVMLGYKPGEASDLFKYIDEDTYDCVDL
jgi:DNA helicase IV